MKQHNTDAALRSLGWRSPDTAGLHLDTTGSHDFQLGRAWSAHDTWTSIRTHGRLTALLVTEGACLLTYDSQELWIEENHLILLDSAVDTRISVLTPTVRYLWQLETSTLRNPLTRASIDASLPVSSTAALPLTSLTNALFTADSAMAESLHIARSIEHLLLAVLTTTSPQFETGRTFARLASAAGLSTPIQARATPRRAETPAELRTRVA